MLEEYWEFDRKMIHENYTAVVEKLQAGNAARFQVNSR
jgi:hypothetical protein